MSVFSIMKLGGSCEALALQCDGYVVQICDGTSEAHNLNRPIGGHCWVMWVRDDDEVACAWLDFETLELAIAHLNTNGTYIPTDSRNS